MLGDLRFFTLDAWVLKLHRAEVNGSACLMLTYVSTIHLWHISTAMAGRGKIIYIQILDVDAKISLPILWAMRPHISASLESTMSYAIRHRHEILL